jgi:oxygen-independent coproporphyrinogen-3 oxidase
LSLLQFSFSTSFGKKDELIQAIIKEVRLQSDYLKGQEINTIYSRRRTPQPYHLLISVLYWIPHDNFMISSFAEITLESNPMISMVLISLNGKLWVSIDSAFGIQAFQDALLKAWNRSHNC